MTIPFVDRDPTEKEFERFRLILSTYQDGSGQQTSKAGNTLPGWRDFERAVALAFGGIAQESKYIFDVLIPDTRRRNIHFGVSCKMWRTLNDTKRNGRVTLELSNSSGKFWAGLKEQGINQQNYKGNPVLVAKALLGLVESWHYDVGLEKQGPVDLSKSFYLALSWSPQGDYRLFKFALPLPDATMLTWDFPAINNDGEEKIGRRLRGQDNTGTPFEWYGESGGQLKYYPSVEDALWKSDVFRLETLPDDWDSKHGILAKAKDYFPELWRSLE